jgi:Tfp pilus assembly protein FimT
MIDTNDTKGVAEALIGDLIFARTRAESMETPTSMLR